MANSVVRTLALGGLGVLGALWLIGVAMSRMPSPTPTISAATAAPLPPPVILPAHPQPFVQRTSIASFRENVLDECVDITITVEPPDGATIDWKPNLPAVGDALQKDKIEIKMPCSQQFADRQALAKCRISETKDGKGVEFVAMYFNYETVGTRDDYMRDCLKGKGEWQAVSRDSQEFRRARLGAAIKDVEDLAKVQ